MGWLPGQKPNQRGQDVEDELRRRGASSSQGGNTTIIDRRTVVRTPAAVTSESDPVFTAWDKSTGISITESQISDLGTYLTAETDPVFSAAEAALFEVGDKALLDSALQTETDPVFSGSEAANFAAGDAAKLAGIEAGAEVNNISDVNATDLTDGGATTLHSHAGGGDAFTVMVSANDTTPGYMNGKLTAGTGITLTEGNNGGDETLAIACTITDTDTKAKVSANDTTAGYLNGKLAAGTGITLTEGNDAGDETLTVACTIVDTNTDTLVKVSANDTTAGVLNGKLVAGTGISLTEGSDGGNETFTIASTGATINGSKNIELAASNPNIFMAIAAGSAAAAANGPWPVQNGLNNDTAYITKFNGTEWGSVVARGKFPDNYDGSNLHAHIHWMPSIYEVHDCDAVWTAAANVTCSIETTIIKEGTGSAKMICATALGANALVATRAVTSVDMRVAKYNKVSFWFRSTLALDAGDWQVGFSNTVTLGGSPVFYNLPAISANTWTLVEIVLTAPASGAQSSLSAVISVGFKQITDKAALTAYADYIIAYGSGDVVWGVQGIVYGDGEDMGAAWPAAVEVTDTAQHGLCCVSGATGTINWTGTPAAGKPFSIVLYRRATLAGDTLTDNANMMFLVLDWS